VPSIRSLSGIPMKKHTNRLIHEQSGYLRQHAHNPVDWYPWGEEAFQKAISENKPVLVSIGYLACHWCHVMEKECFEDAEIAALMNERFVNIKVDREERPDLDQIYMEAVQAITHSGGWPLNVFLTPSRQAFFGGTYYPPVPAFNRPSWSQVIVAVSDAYRDRREEIDQQGISLTRQLQSSSRVAVSPHELGTMDQGVIFNLIMSGADLESGGFGMAPKFPSTMLLKFLLRYHYFHRNEEALRHVELSLDKMIAGGIYDQLGGGFCRYSTDREWLVPHFEKMLYDNALLLELISEAFQVTRKPLYDRTIRQTLEYVFREMASPEGGYYSALDADSGGEEGRYYIWKKPEADLLLGKEAPLFCQSYDITEEGNWEGKNILHAIRQPDQQEQERLVQATSRLLAEREKRERPLLDDKVLLSWNALLCTAFCKAYAALGDKAFRLAAENNMMFIWTHLREPGTLALYHCWQNGKPRQPAFLDDYAFLIQALIGLQEITAERDWLDKAKSLTDQVITHFWDAQEGFFFFTPEGQADLLFRKKEVFDHSTPSGNAVMCGNLHYLSVVYQELHYREMATRMAAGMVPQAIRYPSSHGVWLQSILDLEQGFREIVIMGKNYGEILQQIQGKYLPCKVLMASARDDDRFPLLRQRFRQDSTSVYLCRDYACSRPLEDSAEVLKELDPA